LAPQKELEPNCCLQLPYSSQSCLPIPTHRRVSSRFFAEYLRPANLEASANTSCHYRIMVLGVKIPKQFLFEPQTESPLMPDEPEPLADHLSDRAVRAAKSADFFPKCFIYQWLGIFAPP
jgi:hypothetical protein